MTEFDIWALIAPFIIVVVIGVIVLIFLVRRYGFLRSIGIAMVLFGAYQMYEAFTNPQPSIIPFLDIPIYTGLEPILGMIAPLVFLTIGALLFKFGGIKQNTDA